MASLFDLAAELSQYNVDERTGAERATLSLSKSPKRTANTLTSNNQDCSNDLSQLSVLALFDDTLQTLYDGPATKQPPQLQQPAAPPVLRTQLSAPQLLSPSKPAEKPDRQPTSHLIDASRSRSSSSLTPLQSVFARTIPHPRVPPPPPPPPSSPSPSHTPTVDPDVTAKAALRDLAEEIDQLPVTASDSPGKLQRLQRALRDKYLSERLNKLPATPFVSLARRKTQQKIQQLTMSQQPESQPQPQPATASAMSLAPDQHSMLLKLACVPDSHVAKLGSTQARMVQFAKRYDKILRLSGDELARLPVSQAQLLQQLQRQMPAQLQR